MGFEVNTSIIRNYAGVVDDQAGHSEAAIKYLDKYGEIDNSGFGLIQPAQEVHPELYKAVRKGLKEAKTFFESTEKNLSDAADIYDKTDQENAAKLDATYDDELAKAAKKFFVDEIPVAGPDEAMHPIAEVADPENQLDKPKEPKEFTDPFYYLNQLNNLLSPAAHIQTACNSLWGWNPAEKAIEEIGGEWKEFAEMAFVYRMIAKYYHDVAANMAQYRILLYHWRGNAAAHAGVYLYIAAVMLDARGTDMEELADSYQEMAVSVSEFTRGAVNAVNAAFDWLFWAGVKAIASGATVEVRAKACSPCVATVAVGSEQW